MFRKLSLVCVLALILLPLTLGAQSNPPYQQEQDRNVSQPNQSERSVTQDPSTMQNQQNRDRSQTSQSEAAQESEESTDLPATAGELPLLGLIGALALGAAAGTRLLVRVRN